MYRKPAFAYIWAFMWRVLIFCALLWLSFFSLAAQFLPFSEQGKFGLKNEQGVVVVAPVYEAIGWSDGTFSIHGSITGFRLQGQWGLLHVQKQSITNAEYATLLPAGGDYFLATRQLNPFTTKFGLLQAEGKISIPFYYDGLEMAGLRAIVFNKNGSRYEHGVVSLSDQRIIPLKYKSVVPLGTLRYAVEDFDGRVALFSDRGVPLTEFVIDSISSFRHDHAIVYQALQQGLINREGEWVVKPGYREIRYDQAWIGRKYAQWAVVTATHEPVKTLDADELQAAGAYLRIRKANRYGLLTADWNTKLPPRYEHLAPCGHHWIVRQRGKYGLIRADGSEVLPARFDTLMVQNNLVRVVERPWGDPVWSVYDTFGIRKTKRYYQHIAPFQNNMFVVNANGFYGVADRYGNEPVACVYDSIVQVHAEKLVVRFKGLYGIISAADRWLLLPQPFPVELVSGDYFLQREPAATWLKKLDGEVVYFTMNPLHVDGDLLREEIAGQPDRIIGVDGREQQQRAPLTVASVARIFVEHEGMRGVLRDGRYGFVDAKGKLRVANRYEGIGYFSEGVAPVKILGRWGFVNVRDQVVINPNYDSVSAFVHDRAIASRDNRWGVINKKGDWVLPPRYSLVTALESGDYRIASNGLVGLAAPSGMVLIEPRFETLDVLPTTDVVVQQQGKYGLLSREGLNKIPLVYDALIYQPATQTFLASRPATEEKLFP